MTRREDHDSDGAKHGTALCMSGGGFRATLFHLGALTRLNELALLSRIDTFSSVSGGSILNGVLACSWTQLASGANGVFANFDDLIAEPIRKFCKQDLRTSVLVWDRANPKNFANLLRRDFSATDLLAKAYAESLSLNVRLDSLPSTPRFIFCATNMETGTNWEFGRRDHGSQRSDYVIDGIPAQGTRHVRAHVLCRHAGVDTHDGCARLVSRFS